MAGSSTTLAKRRVLADGLPRYTAYFAKTSRRSFHEYAATDGYDWSVTDESTGLVVRSGWVAGPKRDAQAEARLAIAELEGKS